MAVSGGLGMSCADGNVTEGGMMNLLLDKGMPSTIYTVMTSTSPHVRIAGRHRIGPLPRRNERRPEQGLAALQQEAGAGGQGIGRISGTILSVLFLKGSEKGWLDTVLCCHFVKQRVDTQSSFTIHSPKTKHTGRLRLRRQDQGRVSPLHSAPDSGRCLPPTGPARVCAERHPAAAGM